MTPQEQAAALADRLLAAHRLLREADLGSDDQASTARRLIAISDASKHDVGRAAARLEGVLQELQAARLLAEQDEQA